MAAMASTAVAIPKDLLFFIVRHLKKRSIYILLSGAAMGAAASLWVVKVTESSAKQAAVTPKKPKVTTRGRMTVIKALKGDVDTLAKDLSIFKKNHEDYTNRFEKQISKLSSEVALLKSRLSKENTIAVKKQEANFSKILAKLSTRSRTERKLIKKSKKALKM